jgi:hypothetical protein
MGKGKVGGVYSASDAVTSAVALVRGCTKVEGAVECAMSSDHDY